MGIIFYPNNDKRYHRAVSLNAQIKADWTEFERLSKANVKRADQFAALVAEILERQGSRVENLIPADMSPNLARENSFIYDGDLTLRRMGWGLGLLGGFYAARLQWGASWALTAEAEAAVAELAVTQATANLAVGEGVFMNAGAIEQAIAHLGFGEKLAAMGIRGVARFGARALLTSVAGLAAFVAIDLAFQFFSDRSERDHLVVGIRALVKQRFKIRCAKLQAEKVAARLDEYTGTARGILLMMKHSRSRTQRGLRVDVSGVLLEPFIKAAAKDARARCKEALSALKVEDKGLYTEDDPPASEYQALAPSRLAEITKIKIWRGDVIDAIQCVRGEEESEKWGGGGGVLTELILAKGEEITSVEWTSVPDQDGQAAVTNLLINTTVQSHGPYGDKKPSGPRDKKVVVPTGGKVVSMTCRHVHDKAKRQLRFVDDILVVYRPAPPAPKLPPAKP